MTELTFREYVDKFVSENSDYSSADELLGAKIKKPFFAGGKINKLRTKHIEKIDFEADIADFIAFLNNNLGVFKNTFGTWSPVVLKSPSAIRSALTGNNNQTWTEVPLGDPSTENRYDEKHICTTVNGKQNIIAKVCITHENFDVNNPNRNIIFEVLPRVFASPCPSKYELSVKLIPILHAAAKYYLEVYLAEKKEKLSEA